MILFLGCSAGLSPSTQCLRSWHSSPGGAETIATSLSLSQSGRLYIYRTFDVFKGMSKDCLLKSQPFLSSAAPTFPDPFPLSSAYLHTLITQAKMSLMIRIPSRNTDRRTTQYSTAGYSSVSEWENWQLQPQEKHATRGRRFSSPPSGDSGSDGISLRQRLQALTRQLRRRSRCSLPRRNSSSSQIQKGPDSNRLSVLSKFAKFAHTSV